MYLLHISYGQPPSQVQPHVAGHSAWVKKHIDEGSFLFAGPKKSGLGGVIVARSMARSALNELIATDVYVRADVVDYQIVDFDCKIATEGLAGLLSR